MEKTIDVEIPRGFYNCGVSVDNFFIADTNNTADWKTLKFPLPDPPGEYWSINNYDNSVRNQTTVRLISYYE